MKPLRFERDRSDGLWTWIYIAEEQSFIERPWPGLFEKWEDGPTPFTTFNVNNNNWEEAAIYLGLIWRLSQGRSLLGVPRFYPDIAAEYLGRTPQVIFWEYEVEEEEGPELGAIRGFVPARSSPGSFTLSELLNSPELEAVTRSSRPEAGVFELHRFEELRDLQAATLSDASSSLNLYAITAGREPAIVEALRDERRPKPANLPESGELLINLTLGVDHGYRDVVLIQSSTDISDRLDELAEEYAAKVAAYEQCVDDVTNMRDFLDRLSGLVGVGKVAARAHP